MPRSGISVQDFVRSSRRYVESAVNRANADKNPFLRRAEAKALPADLQDNYAKLSKGVRGSIGARRFIESYAAHVAGAASLADRNQDDWLTKTDGRRLPPELRDNFENLLAARAKAKAQGARDLTPPGLIAAHLAAYGQGPVGYAEAFRRALEAVIANEDSGESPRAIVREFGGPDGGPITSKTKLDAAMKRLMAQGGLELLEVGESDEHGSDPEANWIFAVDIETGSDHGFWAIVDRRTGETTVDGFN
jgi:hypothetical protein